MVNEFVIPAERPALGRAVALVTFSLFLSFGVGLLMSYVAFVAKDPQGRWRDVVSLFGAGVAVLAVVTWLGMTALAGSMESAPHDHGTQQTPVGEAPAEGGPDEHDARACRLS